jgi:hypothetical protein
MTTDTLQDRIYAAELSIHEATALIELAKSAGWEVRDAIIGEKYVKASESAFHSDIALQEALPKLQSALRLLDGPGVEAEAAAQRAIERGDDPATVEHIRSDTAEILSRREAEPDDNEEREIKYWLMRKPEEGGDYDLMDLCYSVSAIGTVLDGEADATTIDGIASALKIIGAQLVAAQGNELHGLRRSEQRLLRPARWPRQVAHVDSGPFGYRELPAGERRSAGRRRAVTRERSRIEPLRAALFLPDSAAVAKRLSTPCAARGSQEAR